MKKVINDNIVLSIVKRNHNRYEVVVNLGAAILSTMDEKEFEDFLGFMERLQHKTTYEDLQSRTYVFPQAYEVID